MPGHLTLEIVEGPGAGLQHLLDSPIVIGRAADSDLTLEDVEVSRRHARVSPAEDGSAVVEDLESANGTFVNHNQVHGRARVDAGDELLVGVTLIQVRSQEQVSTERTVLRPVPPALASAPRPPSYVNPDLVSAEGAGRPSGPGTPELDKYLDARVRRRARLAPLALFALVALVLIIYLATR
jgi:pSer/pThr/pTyr-binding forkhead associated (FHA) protein